LPAVAEISRQFSSRIDQLRGCCNRVDELRVEKQMGLRECELLYESTFLAAQGYFEAVLGELLEECVCGRFRGTTGRYRLIAPKSRVHFRGVLTQRRKYVDYMPYKSLVDTSKMYLHEGRPFSEVPIAQREMLAHAMKIRNAIAHRSSYAVKVFRKDVPGVGQLPANRRTPGVLLKRVYRRGPDERYLDLYFDSYEFVVKFLVHRWTGRRP